MIVVSTAPWAHYAGDAAAWICGAITMRWQHWRWPEEGLALARVTRPGYFVALGLGALAGAWLFGSANTLRTVLATPSHSIGGALAGGIVAVELWKWMHGVRRSTGGALIAGLPDYTYGTETGLPWAVDLGDGLGRHPVEIYESLAMALFLAVYVAARLHGAGWATRHAFQAFVIAYAVQRSAWEFLKPYPAILGPFNIFHVLMVGLIAYGIVWWRRGESDGGIVCAVQSQGRSLHLSRADNDPV